MFLSWRWRKSVAKWIDVATRRMMKTDNKLDDLAAAVGYRWDPDLDAWDGMPSLQQPQNDQIRTLQAEMERLVREAEDRGKRLDDLIRKLELYMPNESEPISKDNKKRRLTL